jgi:toluene monooxygenase system protein D
MEPSGSKSPSSDEREAVGPVLTPGPITDAVIAAIRGEHADVQVIDRGAYLRVMVPRRCRLDRARVERLLRANFELPADLEAIMPSFRGRLTIASDQVVWELAGGPA